MSENPDLRQDSPLEHPDKDRLGYSGFANQLAETISHRTPTDGYTIGINGPWGSGKSTILYFIEHYLEEYESSPAVVRFNPWWFSGEADLLDKFLTEIAVTLESEDGFPDIRSQMAKLSNALSQVPFETITSVPAGRGFAALASVLEEEAEGIEDLKETIESELDEVERNIIVVIDDIDRLTPEEIVQMFQIIKNIADFPNTIYVLAFDQTIVADSLKKEANVGDGDEYIEKIVQLPLHIPEHRAGALEELFVDELSKIPGQFTFEEDRWDSLLRGGVLPTLNTPRDVTRLVNTVDVMLAAVGDEVNFTDLIGLETLRVFYTDVYDAIRVSPNRFIGHRSPSGRLNRSDPDQYEDVLGDLESREREAVESILKTLFPLVIDNLLDKYSTHSWDDIRVNKRICHRDRFPVYFRLNIPEGELSSAEIGVIMSSIGDVDEFKERLEQLLDEESFNGFTKANIFLRRLIERIDEVDARRIEPMLTALFQVGDDIILSTPERSRGRETTRIVEMIRSALKIVDPSDRLDVIKPAISTGDSIYLSSYFLRAMRRNHGEYSADAIPENERVLESTEIDEVHHIVAEQISDAAERGRLLELPWIKWSIEFWANSRESDQLEVWIMEVVDTDEGLLQFIDRMSSTTVLNMNTPVKYIDPRWIDSYLDLDEVQDRLDSIERKNIGDHEVDIIERFEKGMKMLDEGADPSSTENWLFGWAPDDED